MNRNEHGPVLAGRLVTIGTPIQPAHPPPARLVASHRIGCPLSQLFTFELCQACHHREEEPARRCAGVDSLGQTRDVCSRSIETFNDLDRILDIPSKPTQ